MKLPSVENFVVLPLLALALGGRAAGTEDEPGKIIYFEHCASCHGDEGEGVDEEYDEPLWGDRSLKSLTRYIHKSMPEDEEELVEDEDAAAVSRYVYDAFYSPAAQARLNPPRVELLRLTNNQFRQSVTDLFGSLRGSPRVPKAGGLKARYFETEKMNKEKKKVAERVDPTVNFDFGEGVPIPNMNRPDFSIRWDGSLIAPESGWYDFRLKTHNGALMHLNAFSWDDGEDVFVDAYVSTGNALQEKTNRIYLLGGRSYPLRLKYFSFQEKVSTICLEWKRPHGVWETIPAEQLSPEWSPPVMLVQSDFSADDRSLGYERGADVSPDWQRATTYAAVNVANDFVERLEELAQLKGKERRNPERLKEVAKKVAERAARRPLVDDQLNRRVDRFFVDGADPVKALKESVLLSLISPRFLYPGLAGNPGEPEGYAVANRLALTLWDSLPDEALRKDSGKLTNEEARRIQAWRMLHDPRARNKVREFFRYWLAMDEREDMGKDEQLFPGFDQRIVADLRESLTRFVDDVVWSETSDYRQLLLADYLLLNPRLAEFYGAPVGEGSEFAKTQLPDSQRTGVFTHPYLLSANAYHDNSSPIHRGVFLSRHVMGRLLKPPPEAVAFKNDEFDPTLTMREKVVELTKEESCMQCHRVINPVGFSLESFDAVGRYRTEDNDKAVNTVSDYVTDGDETVEVRSAKDLAKLTVESETAHRAFITHLFHHLVKQPVAAYGPDTLETLRRKFVDSGYHIQTLIVEIALVAADYHLDEPTAPHSN